MKKNLCVILSCVLLTSVFTSCAKNSDLMPVKKVHDYVFDLGTYHEMDYDFAEDFIQNKYDGWDGACTAVAKKTDDGKMLVGRNMDLYISNKPAYIMRTAVEGNYKTIGINYSNKSGDNYLDVLKKGGVSKTFYKIVPFLCTDVMNEKGLYVETNMRMGEYWATGKLKNACTGTNPGAKHRICSLILPRYLGENCATVKEAIELVKELDIYTPKAVGMDWNFCFMMADSEGDYGLLEIARNKISWLQNEPAQSNFFVTKEFQENEELACGVGRYTVVREGRDKVKNEQDMYELMKKVNYSKVYDPENCDFDVRTEFVSVRDDLTYSVMTNNEIKDKVYEGLIEYCKQYSNKTRQELQDDGTKWESTFTEVANCTDKTWFVRFFEDDNRTIKFDLKEEFK